MAAATAVAITSMADIRLSEYGQVAGVSNQVMSVDAKIDAATNRLAQVETSVGGVSNKVYSMDAAIAANTEAVGVATNLIAAIAEQSGVSPTATFTNPPVGESQARMNFVINSGDGAYIPPDNVQSQLLVGAKINVTVGNNTYRYKIPSLTPNTSISTAMSVTGEDRATVSVTFGNADEMVLVTKQFALVKEGHSYTIALDCHKAVAAYRQIGRAQLVGANSTAKSYLIVKDSDGNGDVQTKFGYYTDSLGTQWFDETGFMNDVRICKVNDGVLSWGWNSVDNQSGGNTWESQFPWKDFKYVDVVTDATGTGGTNVFKFVEFPIYYVKYEPATVIPVVTRYESGGSTVCTTNNSTFRIWWICETQLPGYILPPWEKVWTTAYDTETTTIVKTGVPKAKNYYARYKSVDKTMTIAGASKAILQSFPWSGTVTGGTRNEDNNRAHWLNDCNITVDGVSYGPDYTGRRFALTGWNDYMAVAFLTYIHLGPDVQGWVYGNCGSTSIAQSKQDCLEHVFSQDPSFNFKFFAIGDTAQSQAPFSYCGIVNLWGSEGDQMADATFFHQRLANSNTVAFVMTQLDRSKYTPHETNLQTLSGLGYERLSFNVNETGYTSTSYRGLDTREDYWGFWISCNKPDYIAHVNAGVDNTWVGGAPGNNAQAAVTTSAYMCSLSHNRVYARSLGAWSVYAADAPGSAHAASWGARLSMVIPAAE